MKKLLTTSILATLIAGSAVAAPGATVPSGPSVKIGGILDFQAATRSQTTKYGNNVGLLSQNNKNVKFFNDAHIFVKAEGRADNGLVYGAVVKITPTASLDPLNQANKNNKKLERTYLFLESEFGRLELGSNYTVGETMKVGAEKIAAATGGISGDYMRYMNINMVDMNTSNSMVSSNFESTGEPELKTFIEEPNLLSDYEVHLTGDAEKTRKISYYTPRVSGFQFGLSYTPDSVNRGNNGNFAYTGPLLGSAFGQSKTRKNELNGGIHYIQQFKNHMILTAALTGDYATGKLDTVNGVTSPARKTLGSYNFGLQLDAAGWSLAGSYGNWGKSLNSKTDVNYQTLGQARYWTAGVAYSQGPAKASFTYMNSKFDQNKKQVYALGGDYILAPGFLPYAEIVRAEYKPFNKAANNEANTKNNATVYIIGTELTF